MQFYARIMQCLKIVLLNLKRKVQKLKLLFPLQKKQAFNDSINKQIQQIESHLNSIQIKWDYVQNDPSENQLATDNGWFDDMTAIKNSLTTKKQVLTDSLK